MGSIPTPPKFGGGSGKTTGQGPSSVSEWVQFYRFLLQLWNKAENSTTDQQVQSMIPQSAASVDARQALQESIGIAQSRVQLPSGRQSPPLFVSDTGATRQQTANTSDQAELALIMSMRPPYPSGAASGFVLQDTHAARLSSYPATNYAIGTLFFETDRTVIYINQGTPGSSNWVFCEGVCYTVQSAIPNDLGTNDIGFLNSVTDYGHMLEWTGTAWQWGPGEPGSGMLQLFDVDPTGPGWHLYDGSLVSFLKKDGTLGTVTLPNLSGASPIQVYLKTGATNTTPNAPVLPTLTTSGLSFTGTAGAVTGTASTPLFFGNPATPTVASVSSPTFTGTALAGHSHFSPIGVAATLIVATNVFGSAGSVTAVTSVVGTPTSAAFSPSFTSTDSAGTPAGTVSAPTVTMNSYTPFGTCSAPTLSMANFTPVGTVTGTVTATTAGEPENLVRRAWFRQ